MLADCFPLRLRAVYVVGLPRVLSPLATAARALLTRKQKARLRLSRTCAPLRDAIDPKVLPPSLGGAARFDWHAIVGRLLAADPMADPAVWLGDVLGDEPRAPGVDASFDPPPKPARVVA